MSDSGSGRQLANMGRALVQVNLRLSRVLELLEGKAGGGSDQLGTLLDLIEACERTLESAQLPAPRRGWLRRWLAPPPPDADLEGLRIALARSRDALLADGLVPTPLEGVVDPRLHQVIEVLGTDDPGRDEHIARTHRRGWHRPGDPPTIIRQAQVSAWRYED